MEITETEAIRAEYVPKAMLTQLLQRSRLEVRTSSPELVDLLNDEMVKAMRRHPLLTQIENAIEELTAVTV